MALSDDKNHAIIEPTDRSFLVWLVVSIVMMVLVAITFFTYPFPGKEATLLDFIKIWLREVLVLGLIVVGLVIWLYNKVKQ